MSDNPKGTDPRATPKDRLADLAERVEDLHDWIDRVTYIPDPEQWAAEASADLAGDVCISEDEASARIHQIRKEAAEAAVSALSAAEAYAKCGNKLSTLHRELGELSSIEAGAGHQMEYRHIRETLDRHLCAARATSSPEGR